MLILSHIYVFKYDINVSLCIYNYLFTVPRSAAGGKEAQEA